MSVITFNPISANQQVILGPERPTALRMGKEKACGMSIGVELVGGALLLAGEQHSAECNSVRDAAHIPVCSIKVTPDVCAA